MRLQSRQFTKWHSADEVVMQCVLNDDACASWLFEVMRSCLHHDSSFMQQEFQPQAIPRYRGALERFTVYRCTNEPSVAKHVGYKYTMNAALVRSLVVPFSS